MQHTQGVLNFAVWSAFWSGFPYLSYFCVLGRRKGRAIDASSSLHKAQQAVCTKMPQGGDFQENGICTRSSSICLGPFRRGVRTAVHPVL